MTSAMRRTLRYNLVDVFTDTPLTGNPLAVFTSGKGLTTETMQSIAREMNLSETVFFFPAEGDAHAKIRIFTPREEMPFAGHPTLGSAWVLAGPMEMDQIRVETGAGVIAIDLNREGGHLHLATMHQPLPEFSPCDVSDELYKALGLSPQADLLPPISATNGPSHILVEASSRDELDGLSPNASAVAQLTDTGVLVFAQEDTTCFCRYFAPAHGINEDPATGSANGPLGAHLVLNNRLKSGQTLTVYQGQKMMRPSTLLVTVEAEGSELKRVSVGGAAVVVARGELQL